MSFSVPKIEAKYSAIYSNYTWTLMIIEATPPLSLSTSMMASEVELRLKERHELRKAALEEKRKEKSKDVSEEETSDYFRKQFSRQQDIIES